MAEIGKYIAVDLGAESGRVMLGLVSGDRLVLDEIHRFENVPVENDGVLRWDFERLFSEVKAGIAKAVKESKEKISGIAVDSWGAGLGLIDGDGKLIEDPYHYRDDRMREVMEKAFELMPKREIYENSGIQFMLFNDIYRLLHMRLTNAEALARAKKVLFMADLFAYHLCGRIYSEYTIGSASQLMDMRSGAWSEKIFDKLSLPIGVMGEIVQAGTVVGELTEEIAKELGCGRIPVIAVGSHDTASAVAGVPAGDRSWAFLSSGTWSLMGIEVGRPIINDKAYEYEFTNEGGVENTIRFLKNIMGLWLVQQCRGQWAREGSELSYAELAEMAKEARPFAGRIDPDCADFYPPGDMPKRINDYLVRTNQEPINDKGQMVRVILESLAFKYRWVAEKIEDICGKKIECLHIVGGGIKNELLCQFTANSIGKKVVTGPVEATAAGNVLMQAKAVGQVKSLKQIREIVRNSFELKEYLPEDAAVWEDEYKKFGNK